jgi:hypothetical protein
LQYRQALWQNYSRQAQSPASRFPSAQALLRIANLLEEVTRT